MSFTDRTVNFLRKIFDKVCSLKRRDKVYNDNPVPYRYQVYGQCGWITTGIFISINSPNTKMNISCKASTCGYLDCVRGKFSNLFLILHTKRQFLVYSCSWTTGSLTRDFYCSCSWATTPATSTASWPAGQKTSPLLKCCWVGHLILLYSLITSVDCCCCNQAS